MKHSAVLLSYACVPTSMTSLSSCTQCGCSIYSQHTSCTVIKSMQWLCYFIRVAQARAATRPLTRPNGTSSRPACQQSAWQRDGPGCPRRARGRPSQTAREEVGPGGREGGRGGGREGGREGGGGREGEREGGEGGGREGGEGGGREGGEGEGREGEGREGEVGRGEGGREGGRGERGGREGGKEGGEEGEGGREGSKWR